MTLNICASEGKSVLNLYFLKIYTVDYFPIWIFNLVSAVVKFQSSVSKLSIFFMSNWHKYIHIDIYVCISCICIYT